MSKDNEAKITVEKEISEFLKICDAEGNTLLHYVAKSDNVELAKQLIAAGSDVNIKNNEGDVPLHFAATYNRADMVELLVKTGADVNAINYYHESLLHDIILKGAHNKAMERDHFRIIKTLIKAGINLKQIFSSDTVLLLRVFLQHRDKFNFILSIKPEISKQIDLNDLTFGVMSRSSSLDDLKELIKLGFDINAQDENGNNVLHYALGCTDCETVEFSLKNNINVNTLNDGGLDPLCYSLERWSHLDFFRDKSHTEEERIKICPYIMKSLKLLLDSGYDVNHMTGDQTPLYKILERHQFMPKIFAQILLRYGAKFDFQHPVVHKVFNDLNDTRHAQLLLRHVAMFEAQNRNDGPKNFDINNYKTFREYYAKCRDELELMKTTKIDDTNVSFFNILVNRDIGPFTRNECVKNVMSEEQYVTKKFPTYGYLVIERFSEEVEIQKIVEKAKHSLSCLLNLDEVSSHLILSTVLKYLNKNDLSNLGKI